MYAMDDPRYVYRPRTPEQRRAQSLRERRRLGIPDGCARLYALHVPVHVAEQLRDDAAWIANNLGWSHAQSFIEKAQNIDWELAGELYDEWASYRELAEFFGVPGWFIEKGTRHLRRINPRGTTEPRHE